MREILETYDISLADQVGEACAWVVIESRWSGANVR